MPLDAIFAIIITITALASYINYRFLRFPQTIGLTFITLSLSLSVIAMQALGVPHLDLYAKAVLDNVKFDATFLNGMLGFLLFAGALHINLIELAKQRWIIAMLSTISVALSTFLVATLMKYLGSSLGFHLPWAAWLIFGALISPTDPIAVLGILKSLPLPRSIMMKIAGESLFNDGAAIVLFVVFSAAMFGNTHHEIHDPFQSTTEIILYFIQQAGGGITLGLLLGYIASLLLKKIDDGHVATLITLSVVSAGYASAEHLLGVSGVLAMGVSGLIIGFATRYGGISREGIASLDEFWEIVDEILNAVLFVMIGLEFLRLPLDTISMSLAICAVMVTVGVRFVSVALPVWLNSLFRKFTPNVVMLMTWGGIRGGVSIALALTLPDSDERNIILALTYSVVIFSILVQGLTLKRVTQKLFCSKNS